MTEYSAGDALARGANLPAGLTRTTMAPFDIEALVKTVRELTAEGRRIDSGMVAALNKVIADDGRGLGYWSVRLRVDFVTLVETLDGKRQPDAYFWEQVRRVFGEKS